MDKEKFNKRQREYIANYSKEHMAAVQEQLGEEYYMRMLELIEEIVEIYESGLSGDELEQAKFEYLVGLRCKLSDIGKEVL